MITYDQKDIDRFWSKIIFPEDVEDYCWEYDGGKNKYGYGQFSLNNYPIYSHRFSFMIHNQNVDISDKLILHSCHNPGCVNPKHLRPGTHQDNMDDRNNADRQVKGSRVWSSKINDDIVREILTSINSGEFKNYNHVYEYFDISKLSLTNILNENNWKNVSKNFDMASIRKKFISNDYTTRTGYNNIRSKITKEQLVDVRNRLSNNETCSSIARLYNVSVRLISRIKNNEAYNK